MNTVTRKECFPVLIVNTVLFAIKCEFFDIYKALVRVPHTFGKRKQKGLEHNHVWLHTVGYRSSVNNWEWVSMIASCVFAIGFQTFYCLFLQVAKKIGLFISSRIRLRNDVHNFSMFTFSYDKVQVLAIFFWSTRTISTAFVTTGVSGEKTLQCRVIMFLMDGNNSGKLFLNLRITVYLS